ncbi:hypothetical protein EYF80_029532 [Liparis tanakae]|uniref:Uncharacterized protein n=1 Tax=Liparis tanakae TaxID=230148 RepID=A0A4Z2H3E9_9TELE|nr:hypothetical protein EYF80_029532 [Liparis tanakae]
MQTCGYNGTMVASVKFPQVCARPRIFFQELLLSLIVSQKYRRAYRDEERRSIKATSDALAVTKPAAGRHCRGDESPDWTWFSLGILRLFTPAHCHTVLADRDT